MRRRDGNDVPEQFEGLVRRLRAERPELEPLQSDRMKTRVMVRARAPRSNGATVKGRIVVALLALGLMGAGAGGVVAGGGDTSPGQQSGTSQYQPAKCHTDKAGNVKGCNCPDHSNLVFTGGSFQCQCPDGSSFDSKGNKCGCPDGMKFDDKTDSCVSQGGPPPPPPKDCGHDHNQGGGGSGCPDPDGDGDCDCKPGQH